MSEQDGFNRVGNSGGDVVDSDANESGTQGHHSLECRYKSVMKNGNIMETENTITDNDRNDEGDDDDDDDHNISSHYHSTECKEEDRDMTKTE